MHFCVTIFALLIVVTGLGCDTAAVINILGHRNAMQRNLIQQEYRAMYSEELNKRLASELRGNVEVNTSFVVPFHFGFSGAWKFSLSFDMYLFG